jgi:hypothetical protein
VGVPPPPVALPVPAVPGRLERVPDLVEPERCERLRVRVVVDPLDGAVVPVLVGGVVGVEWGLCGLSTLPGGAAGFCDCGGGVLVVLAPPGGAATADAEWDATSQHRRASPGLKFIDDRLGTHRSLNQRAAGV